jgi:hypothetical protein
MFKVGIIEPDGIRNGSKHIERNEKIINAKNKNDLNSLKNFVLDSFKQLSLD